MMMYIMPSDTHLCVFPQRCEERVRRSRRRRHASSTFRSGWRKPDFTISAAGTCLSRRDSDLGSQRCRRSTRVSTSLFAYCSPGRDCSRCRSACSSPSGRRRCRCCRCPWKPSARTCDTPGTPCMTGPPSLSPAAAVRSRSRSPSAVRARIPAASPRSSSSYSHSRSLSTRLLPTRKSSRAKTMTKSTIRDASPRQGSYVSLDPT